MLALLFVAAVSCVPEGQSMPGSNLPVVRVSGAEILDGTSAEDAEAFYRRSFAMTDRDGDGFITGSEIPIGIRGFGSTPFSPSESGTDVWLSGIDKDGDRRVTWKEFSDYFLPLAAIGRCQRGF